MARKKKAVEGAFTRREFLQGAAAVAAGSTISTHAKARDDRDEDDHGRGRRRPPGHEEADIVLENGRIHTMDGRNSIVSSVAIQDGRFIGIGRDVKRGPRCKTIDLRGRTVVPGIIDNHNHIVLMGNRPGYHTPLENAYSIKDVQDIYRARAASAPPGAWITTIGGFHSNHIYATPGDLLSGRLPTLAELDAAVPNNPVFISIGFSGPAVTNTLGKSVFEGQGITVTSTGGISGSTNNQSNVGMALLYLRDPTRLTAAERRRSVLDAMQYAVSVGVTTHLDQGAFQAAGTPADGAAHEDNFTMHIPFLEIYDQGKALVRTRINFLHMESNQDTPELAQRLKNAFPFLGNEWVKTGGIGEFIAQGTNASSPFVEAAKKVARAGWRAEVHSLTRRTTTNPANPADFEFEIMGFEAANLEVPGIVRDKRWVVAHVPGIDQVWIDRLAKIGGNLSLTGWQYLAGSFPTTNLNTPYAGPPFRMIVDSSNKPGGIHAGMSSDGMQIAPMNPWLHMYYATTGTNTKGQLINPGQTITRQEVLELYTSKNGWFLREEDDLGSIEEGKLADLVVLNSDYFTVTNEDLKKIRSVMTIVGGKIMHDTGVVHVRG